MLATVGHGGELEFLEIARPGAPSGLPLVVLLHGRGASADDLAPLAYELGDSYRYVLPNGRLRLAVEGWEGFAWYRLEAVEPDLAASRAALEMLLHHLWDRTGQGPAQTALMGFSQGAVLALDVGLRAPQPFAGLVAMSGYLHEATALTLKGAHDHQLLLVHGVHDPVLPVARGRAARAALEAAGLRPEYHEFAMGHEVSAGSLAAVAAFLHRVLT